MDENKNTGLWRWALDKNKWLLSIKFQSKATSTPRLHSESQDIDKGYVSDNAPLKTSKRSRVQGKKSKI